MERFDENEFKVVGRYSVPGLLGMPEIPVDKWNTPITPRENMQRMLDGKGPLWIPEFTRDCNGVQPMIMDDARARCQGGTDWFGIEWELKPGEFAAMVKPGFKRIEDITQWETLEFPDLSAIDWESDYKQNYEGRLASDRLTYFVIVNGLFERTADLMGFEEAFVSLIAEPEMLTEFWTKLTDWHIELIKIAHDVYHADMILFHDDMGTQRSTFMAPEMYRELLMPHYKRIVSAIHDLGMYADRHSCGCVGTLLPSFIEEGWDIWEGQDSANDKKALMLQYGDKLAQGVYYYFTPDVPDEEAVADIRKHVDDVAMHGKFCCTLFDMNFARDIDLSKELYRYSRMKFAEAACACV